MIEITLKDQQRWQRRALKTLDELLQRGWDEGLPVIAWTVSYAGAGLTGYCHSNDMTQRRRDWQRWTAAVGALPWKERTDADVTHLHALVKDYDGLVDIAIVADLFPEEGEDA